MATPPAKMETRLDPKVEEYWSWAAVALYLLVPVDLLTTLYAAADVGVAAEANPFMAWLIVQPATIVAGVNVGAVVLAATFFYALMEMYRRTPTPYDHYFGAAIEAWLGGLVAAGLILFANNLSVIVLGQSLVG